MTPPKAKSVRMVACHCGCGEITIGLVSEDDQVIGIAVMGYAESQRFGASMLEMSDQAAGLVPLQHGQTVRH